MSFDPETKCRQWHPSMPTKTSVNLLVGPRGSGKTTFGTDVLRYDTYATRGYVVCPTPEAWASWAKCFPMSFIFQIIDETYEEIETKICNIQNDIKEEIDAEMQTLKRQIENKAEIDDMEMYETALENFERYGREQRWSAEVMEKHRKKFEKQWEEQKAANMSQRAALLEKTEELKKQPHIILNVMDDLGFDKQAMKSKAINKTCKNGRHYLKKLYVLCQTFLQFNSENRNSVDWLIVSPVMSTPNFKQFTEIYLNVGKEQLPQLRKLMRHFSSKKWWMCIDRSKLSDNLEDYIYYYKPAYTIITKDWIGNAIYKHVHRITFDPEKIARNRKKYEEYAKTLEDPDGDKKTSKSNSSSKTKAKKAAGSKSEHKEHNHNESKSTSSSSTVNEQDVFAKISSRFKTKNRALIYANFGPEHEAELMKRLVQEEQARRQSQEQAQDQEKQEMNFLNL